MNTCAGDGKNITLTCLGVGDGWPSPDRRPSSFLYQFGRISLLIDCGDAVNLRFARTGVGYDQLDAILLSHLHSDHVGGFSLFIQSLWLENRRRPLPLHLPASAIVPLRAWLDATFLPAELVGFPLQWSPLITGKKFCLGNLGVTAQATTHLDSLRRALQPRHPGIGFEAFSFLLDAPGGRIAHTADIGSVGDLAPLLKRPLDLLVCELAHVEPELLLAELRQHQIARIVFIHLAREFWADLPGTRRMLKGGLGGIPFTIARDGDRFQL